MNQTKVTKDLEAKKLIIERVFNVSKEKLWTAYSDKDVFTKWWGPEGWETTVKEYDLAPGGRVHYCMTCVDEAQGEFYKQDAWGIMKIEAVDAPNSFSYKDYFSDAEGTFDDTLPVITVTVELKDVDGKTALVSTCVGESAEAIEKLVAMGMVEGFTSSTDKLERLMA